MKQNDKEYILCSANWYKDIKSVNDKSRNQNPVNITEGIVFCGHRHYHCLHVMIYMTGLRQCEAGKEIQGFLTNKNRFVTREEAAIIHIENGGTLQNKKRLFSEDLY